MQAARDLSESRKLTLAAGDLVTLVDHRWVAGDGDLKHTQWLFVRMKQRLQSNDCFPVFVSGCQDSEYVMMHSWINLVVSRLAGFVFSKITAISGNNVSTNKRHAKKKLPVQKKPWCITLDSPATFDSFVKMCHNSQIHKTFNAAWPLLVVAVWR